VRENKQRDVKNRGRFGTRRDNSNDQFAMCLPMAARLPESLNGD
jgi:hypothetical protein